MRLINSLTGQSRHVETQPAFIDCQQELLRGVTDVQRQVDRLKCWLAAATVLAVGGWATVLVILVIR